MKPIKFKIEIEGDWRPADVARLLRGAADEVEAAHTEPLLDLAKERDDLRRLRGESLRDRLQREGERAALAALEKQWADQAEQLSHQGDISATQDPLGSQQSFAKGEVLRRCAKALGELLDQGAGGDKTAAGGESGGPT